MSGRGGIHATAPRFTRRRFPRTNPRLSMTCSESCAKRNTDAYGQLEIQRYLAFPPRSFRRGGPNQAAPLPRDARRALGEQGQPPLRVEDSEAWSMRRLLPLALRAARQRARRRASLHDPSQTAALEYHRRSRYGAAEQRGPAEILRSGKAPLARASLLPYDPAPRRPRFRADRMGRGFRFRLQSDPRCGAAPNGFLRNLPRAHQRSLLCFSKARPRAWHPQRQ